MFIQFGVSFKSVEPFICTVVFKNVIFCTTRYVEESFAADACLDRRRRHTHRPGTSYLKVLIRIKARLVALIRR
jgi:hypothetical protein